MNRGDQISTGVFMIGLAVLFATGYWWPGILFVAGAASLARTLAEGRRWYASQGTMWMIGLGLIFFFGVPWWLIFVLMGLTMSGNGIFVVWSSSDEDDENTEKPKRKNNELEAETVYVVGDDGELIPEDEYYTQDKRKHDSTY